MSAMPLLSPSARIVLTLTATAAGGVALLGLKPHVAERAAAPSGPVPAAGPTSGSGSGTGPGSGPGSAAAGGSGAAGTRTVDGETVQTRYGPVQVRVTLTAGKLTAVKILQVPQDNPRDREIASFAVPQLTREALDAQSAHIDTVSGATYTSEGYAQSLQSALDQAGA
jgi:uncharacterized protein with FMN-binding domain